MINKMELNNERTAESMNQCSTCIHWVKQPKFMSALNLKEIDNSETGICAGGGFDKYEVTSNETCSLWELKNQT